MPNSSVSASSMFSPATSVSLSASNSIQIPPHLRKEVDYLTNVNDGAISTHLSHRKSCEFSHHSLACIKKAAVNLAQIETRLNDWYKHVLSNLSLEYSLSSSVLKEVIPTTLESQIKDDMIPVKPKTCIISARSKYKQVGKKQLKSIRMKDLDSSLQNIRSGSLLDILGYDIGDISTEQNIDLENHMENYIHNENRGMANGIMNLLERLESDRCNIVRLLENETERTIKLENMLDAEAYKRIHVLPRKVQEEHDKCICNVRELKWHLEYQSRFGAKARELTEQATHQKKTFQNEIDFIKENNPLLDEKLDLENNAMKVIKAKQDSVNTEVLTSDEKFKNIRQEFEKLKMKAEKLQRIMTEQISHLSDKLNENLNFLLAAQNEHLEMKEGIKNLKRQIEDDTNKRLSGEKHLDNLTEIGLHLKDKVHNCKANIKAQEELYKNLTQSDEDYQKEKVVENEKLTKMRKKLEGILSVNTKELRRIIMLNKKTKKEIQTIKRKMDECEKTKLSNQKAVKRVIEELETVSEHLQLIREQALDLKHLQVTLQLKLEQETLKGEEEREKLNDQLALLQKENKEESHARKTLLARIKAETASFEIKKGESENKKQKMLQTDKDLQKVIENMKQQINSLSEKYEERIKAIEGLDFLLAQVTEKSSNFNDVTSKEIMLLEAREKALHINVIEISAKLCHIDVSTMNMNKKLRDMESSTIMMNKFLSANKKSIEDLEEEISELQMQLEATDKLDEKLRKLLAEVENRSLLQQEKHSDLMSCKQQKHANLDKMLAKSLLENDGLATRYLNLQSKHINKKYGFVTTFEKNKIAQESFNDKESLCELHSQLHEALKCYYQLRGIQTKAGLSRFEEMTKVTYGRLRNIQEELEKCIHNISVFLRATNRSHSIAVLKQAFTSQKGLTLVS